jgi:hypothetical protein
METIIGFAVARTVIQRATAASRGEQKRAA